MASSSTNGAKGQMLSGIRGEAIEIEAWDDSGNKHDGVTVDSTDFDYINPPGDSVGLLLETDVTLTISSGTTITEIRLRLDSISIEDTTEESYVIVEIGGSDGEEFPDGGEIEVTAFEMYVSDV